MWLMCVRNARREIASFAKNERKKKSLITILHDQTEIKIA
jgi:hypothetical protein